MSSFLSLNFIVLLCLSCLLPLGCLEILSCEEVGKLEVVLLDYDAMTKRKARKAFSGSVMVH